MKEFLTDSVFFGAVLSFLAYEIGLLLKKRFKLALLNPLLIGGSPVYQLSADSGDGLFGSASL